MCIDICAKLQKNLRKIAAFSKINLYLHVELTNAGKTMVRTFHSKVDSWYWWLMAATAFGMFYCFWYHETVLTLLAAVLMIFEIEMLIHTCYKVEDNRWLRIESGRFVPGHQVPLAAIVRIRPVRAYSFSPALSFRRLLIEYRKEDGQMAAVQVSPQNEEDFLRWLNKQQSNL